MNFFFFLTPDDGSLYIGLANSISLQELTDPSAMISVTAWSLVSVFFFLAVSHHLGLGGGLGYTSGIGTRRLIVSILLLLRVSRTPGVATSTLLELLLLKTVDLELEGTWFFHVIRLRGSLKSVMSVMICCQV